MYTPLLLIQTATDPFISWLLSNGSEALLWGYLIIDKVLPKFFPQFFRVWNRRVSTEDRLFKIIEDSNQSNKNLAVALNRIEEVVKTSTIAITNLDRRVEQVESKIK